jgi:hypothetical protein
MSELVWQSKLDEKYDCQVVRTGERTGQLTMVETETQKTLLDRSVGLSYGAMFGPDMGDVAYWQDACVKAADDPVK